MTDQFETDPLDSRSIEADAHKTDARETSALKPGTSESDAPSRLEPWHNLTRWTAARIAMGRAGASMRTGSVLDFNRDHALARDAIYTPLDVAALEQQLAGQGLASLRAASRARNRAEYLRRPDLGRALSPDCLAALREDAFTQTDAIERPTNRLTVVIADGLSALAPERHALPLLQQLRQGLASGLQDWQLDKVVLAIQARVALGDGIGELRRATAVLVLIGERPGLRTPDSLGAYLTYHPRIGRTDAERNCVSNIHPGGLSYEQAAFRLFHLLSQASVLGATGVALKDDSDAPPALAADSSAHTALP